MYLKIWRFRLYINVKLSMVKRTGKQYRKCDYCGKRHRSMRNMTSACMRSYWRVIDGKASAS